MQRTLKESVGLPKNPEVTFCTECGTAKVDHPTGEFSAETGNPATWPRCPNARCWLSPNHVHEFRFKDALDVIIGAKQCYCGKGR